jgi:hypothetical protein
MTKELASGRDLNPRPPNQQLDLSPFSLFNVVLSFFLFQVTFVHLRMPRDPRPKLGQEKEMDKANGLVFLLHLPKWHLGMEGAKKGGCTLTDGKDLMDFRNQLLMNDQLVLRLAGKH